MEPNPAQITVDHHAESAAPAHGPSVGAAEAGDGFPQHAASESTAPELTGPATVEGESPGPAAVERESPGPATAEADSPGPTAGHGSTRGDGARDEAALRERVLELLKHVHDPELGINIVDLGLVYDVAFEGDTVHIKYTLTTMGCPIGPMIEAEMKQFVSGVEGIQTVNAEMVLRPPWTPEMMSEEAKAALGFF